MDEEAWKKKHVRRSMEEHLKLQLMDVASFLMHGIACGMCASDLPHVGRTECSNSLDAIADAVNAWKSFEALQLMDVASSLTRGIACGMCSTTCLQDIL